MAKAKFEVAELQEYTEVPPVIPGTMAHSSPFLSKPEFQHFNLIPVDPDEAYAANSVWVNDVVLTPMGFPKTRQLIASAGYQVREVDVSEFQKLDGGLSCLSLRF